MNTVIYCRVSSKEQVEGTSLESQELACREYAAKNRLNVVGIFVERGESAKFADRTQLLELMAFCSKRQHAVERLLVWKVDRLARNVGDHFSIKAGLLKQGVRVISVTEPIDANPEGNLLETILAGFAQFDNDIRAARAVQGMRRKIQDGIFPWNPPLGYKGANPVGSKKLEPDQPDQPAFGLLQQAWEEFATGRYTKVELLRLVTARGLRTRAGRPLSKQSLDNVFHDPFYAGIILDPWSKEEHLGRHLPIVTQATFLNVQKIIAGRTHAAPHRSVHKDFPLRSFVRCLSCQRPLTGSFSRGRSRYYAYYHCFNAECDTPGNLPLDDVHGEFIRFLDQIRPSRKAIARLREYLREAASSLAAGSHALHEKRMMDRKRLQQQQQQLLRLKVEELITDQEFVAQRTLLSAMLAEFEPTGAQREIDADSLLGNIDLICAPLLDLVRWWQHTTIDCQQRFQRLLLPAGYVFSRIGTAQRGRLFCFFSGSAPSESHEVPLTVDTWNQLTKELKTFVEVFGSV